jgi:hypothetical protein
MKKSILRILPALLLLQALFFVRPSVAHAEEMTCPAPLSVIIDIKPAEVPNKINLSAKGVLAVAVLATSDFEASQFAPEMAHLTDASLPMSCAGAAAIRWSLEDVNKDGQLDMVFFFRIQELNLTPSSTAATLMAHGSYNSVATHIVGMDTVQIKP